MGEVNLEYFKSDRTCAFFIDFCRPYIAMNDPKLPSQLEVTQRFLVRFADLMSNGSNAANLLQAAELLLGQTDRAELAEERLRLEQMRSAELEQRLATLLGDDQAHLPKSVVRPRSSHRRAGDRWWRR
ncbi:MAG: hypothetical protein KIT82_05105 [Bradyrhizobium sp.]|nr:hypothetical protein [Bradyrhizobium sp.]